MYPEQFLMYAISFIVLCITIFYAYCTYKYTYWRREKVAYLKPVFPFGNTKDFILSNDCMGNAFKQIYNELKKQTSSFGGFHVFMKANIMLIDPELIKTILTKDFANFHDRGTYLDEDSDPMGAHLVALKGQKWKTSRDKISPTFTSGKMKVIFPIMLATCKELRNIFDCHIKNREPINMKDIFTRQSTDVIGACAFGLECNSLKDPNNKFLKYGKRVLEYNSRYAVVSALSSICPIVLKVFRVSQNNPDVSKFYMNILQESIKHREKNNAHRDDFLGLLIKLKNNQSVLDDFTDTKPMKDETGLSFNELTAHAFSFFAAGFETTSSTLDFCLFELATNPEIQEKVRSEVLDVTNKYNGKITYEGITEMKYMKKVFQEVLRKYPAVPMLDRECTEDFKVPGTDYVIKKGTGIIISNLGMHYDPEYYPDPNKFDPERFSEQEMAKRHPYTYLPFGKGPRQCIGMTFGLLEVKIVLASLLMDFKFKLDPKTKTPILFDPKGIFLLSKETIWLQAERI